MGAVAGWYDDGSGRLRWWDGDQWTEHFADQQPTTEVAVVVAEPSPRQVARQEKALAKNARVAASALVADAFANGTLESVALEASAVEALKAWWWAYQRLSDAAAHAAAGNIVPEEQAIKAARDGARTEGDRTLRKAVEARILRMEQEGRLRIGADLIGTIKTESALSRSGRKVPSTPGRVDAWITVLSDRIVTPTGAYAIDAYTSAQVYLDGQSQITQRPTLTRMALLAPLPGSALVGGMALQKKERIDSRQGEFQVGGRGWSARVYVHPDRMSEPRQLAEQVNRHANAAADKLEAEQRAATPAPAATAPAPATGLNTELAKLAAFKEQGILSDDEFTAAKRQLLGL